MNKYQKALDYLAKNSMFETVEGIEAQELLQELVDRATPKKLVYKHPFQSFGWCPNCNYSLTKRTYPKNCGNCGQALDWSKENEK